MKIPNKKKSGKIKLCDFDPTSKEYAELSIDEVDRMAFGFCDSDIKTISPEKLNVRWHADMENPKTAIKNFISNGGTKRGWAESIDLSEPIQLSYKDGKFFIEDGHHRYTAALILGVNLKVDEVIFRDNPWTYSCKINKNL